MPIQFNQIPSNIRAPGSYIEIVANPDAAGLAQINTRILVISQMLSTGTVAPETPTLITSYDQAVTSFGRGSLMASMFASIFANNPFTEKWAVGLLDNVAGAKSSGTITITGTATAAGTINLYVGGVLVQAAVSSGDTASVIAASINSAINANLDLLVTSTVLSGVVTVTFNHNGLVGNYFDMRINYAGELAGEVTPPGIAVAFVQLTGGTANPDINDAIAALPEERYDFWVIPWRDSGTFTKLTTELTSRNGPLRMLEGYAFASANDTIGNLVTLGGTQNNQYVSIVDAGLSAPTPAFLIAADAGAQVGFAATNDPARPFNTLPLIGALPDVPANRRTLTERNTLLYSGIATTSVTRAGIVQIDRMITTYQLNNHGGADSSWLDANTPLTTAYLRQTLRNMVTTKFPRSKLADDGTRFGAGQQIVTPTSMFGELIALYAQWIDLGLVQDMATFKSQSIVERNLIDRTRLDCVLFVTLVSQLQITAIQIAFSK